MSPRRSPGTGLTVLAGTFLGVAAAVALPAPSHAEQLLKAPFTAIGIGGRGQFIEAIDLDEDGKLDLVSASQYPGEIRVSMGTGGGRFGAPVTYAPSPGGSKPAIADLTGEGHLDIAMADSPNNNVYIQTGNGDGTFGAVITVPIGYQCYTVAAADLNLDGHVDLIAASYTDVAVRMGSGGGNFDPPVTYPTASNAYLIAVGYLNSDNYPDVVASSNYSQVSVLMGVGNGALQPYQALNVGTTINDLAVEDATGDGKSDIVVGVQGGVTIFPGNGSGGFGPRIDIAVAGSSGRFDVDDLNGDSHPDLVMASDGSYTVTETANVLLGDGAGGFPFRSRIESLFGQLGICTGDADGDGKPDILVGNGGGQVALHSGNGDGTFGFIRRYGTGGEPIALGLGDLDGDGLPDLVAAHHGSASFSVRLGNFGGTFGIRRDYETGTSPPQALAVGDLNQDGHADVAVATASDNGYPGQADVSVFLGYAGGSFASSARYTLGQGLAGIAIGNLDEDHAPDLVVTDRVANRVSVLINSGSGSFLAPIHYGAGSGASGVALGDLNGDSHLDIAVANRNAGSVTILFGDGSGGFVTETELPTAPDCRSVAIGLIDGDAIPDLVTGNGTDGSIAVLLGKGGGVFDPARIIPFGGMAASVSIARMNADGLPDLVVGLGQDPIGGYPGVAVNVVGVLLGSGSGAFEPPQFFGAGDTPQQVALADLDANGGMDLVAADRGTDAVTVLMNTSSIVAVGPQTPVAELRLGRGYPNPSAGSVSIPFAIPRDSPASIRIYDTSGRVVRTLVRGVFPAGAHLAKWDRRTDAGAQVGAGIYFYELQAADRKATGRIVLL